MNNNNDRNTLLKPGTLLNNARSPNRLTGLKVLLCAGDLWLEAFSLSWRRFFSRPALEFDADELPDVVDSVSPPATVDPGAPITAPHESNCERKPKLHPTKLQNQLTTS